MILKPTQPKFKLIEHVAAQLAATFYEVGRGQGLHSKFKNARVYAMNNLEKFIPHAIKALLQQLHNPSISAEQKEEIWDALQERINDPMAGSLADSSSGHALPDIDIAKLIPVKELPSVIKDKRVKRDFGINPFFKAKRH